MFDLGENGLEEMGFGARVVEEEEAVDGVEVEPGDVEVEEGEG